MPSDAPFYAPAKRTRVGWLIAIAGGAGSGKTFSALRLATGLAGPTGTIAVADTENGRALYYDDDFKFLYHAIAEPFRPMKFEQAAVMAQREGHAVLIIDNYSHEHTGPGGVLAWHEEELSRLAGEDDAKRERVNQLAWVKPKMARKATLQRFWQLNAHIILCLQAERKTEQQKDPKTGKIKPVDIGFQPVCAAELPYFMTASFLLDTKNPGVPIWPPLKIMGKVVPLFRPGQPLDEATGVRIAAWARGEKPDAASATPATEVEKTNTVVDPVPPPAPPPVDEPPPSRRASAGAKEGEIEAGVEEMIRRFAEVRTRQQHLIVVTEDGFQKRLMWLKRNRRALFDRLNAAIKECWARTDPARAQRELVP